MAQDKQHLTTEQLSDLLDREVSAEEQAQWEAHLSTCPQCQQALEGLRQTVTLLHALSQPTLPRSFVLPIETRVPVAAPKAVAPTPIPIRPARRRLNPYVRRTLRTISALAAVIGFVFFLSGVPHGGMNGTTSATSDSSAGSSVNRPSSVPQKQPSVRMTPRLSPTSGIASALTPVATATVVASIVKPRPIDGSDQQPYTSEQPNPSSWPTIFIFNLSTAAGRVGLGMLLVILGIMGFVLFKRSRREIS